MSELEKFEKRLAGVEKSLKRWKLGAVAMVVVSLFGAANVAKEKTPDVIRAKAFIAEDYDGEIAGMFGVSERGEASQVILVSGKSTAAMAAGVKRIKITAADGSVSYIE